MDQVVNKPMNAVEHMLRTNDTRVRGQLPWLERLPENVGTILDVGAGAGSHSAYFKSRGYEPSALDYNAAQFQHHGSIRFIDGDLLSVTGTFDAIFLSHVLEHIPNTQQALEKIRSLLNPSGYLFIVVPPYDGRVGNDHWHIGWNCAQLSMWLVSAGFDCTDATFMEIGENVCGWGRKADFPDTSLYIPHVKKHLPTALANKCFKEGADDRIPDVVFADRDTRAQR